LDHSVLYLLLLPLTAITIPRFFDFGKQHITKRLLMRCVYGRKVPLLRNTEPAACQVDDSRCQGFFAELATGLHVVSTHPQPYHSSSVYLSVCLSLCVCVSISDANMTTILKAKTKTSTQLT